MEQATFPPRIWAADSSDLWRITNACESFHSRFNSSCASPHPNIFVFVQNLKLVQTDTYIRINSVREVTGAMLFETAKCPFRAMAAVSPILA
uniref:Uncharacterized protein n=1 Tax=Timema genevievae TaxID=629358 RepID=A0A7R9JMJ9_TIMGE|nr:unnamed protein product [Timema genevievae]